MANYNIKQIVYSGKNQCLTSFISEADGAITPTNYSLNAENNKPGDWGDQSAPYQQIILNSESVNGASTFKLNQAYYLELEIPRDENFSMDFALLLIPQPKGTGTDLDQLNYQFIRYLHVPQGSGSNDQSRVVLYQQKKDGEFIDDEDHPITVAIAYPDPALEASEENDDTVSYLANTLYYRTNNGQIEYMWTGDIDKSTFEPNQNDYGYNDIILSHSWKSVSSEKNKTKFKIIFTPRVEGMQCLYLYLIPTKEDNDIQWTEDSSNKTYYGRHVEIGGDNGLTAKLYEMINLISGDTIRRIGVWGRSELMLAINGEEIKIGPSNYYELQNFAITNLGVAAQSAADRFTIDIQY